MNLQITGEVLCFRLRAVIPICDAVSVLLLLLGSDQRKMNIDHHKKFFSRSPTLEEEKTLKAVRSPVVIDNIAYVYRLRNVFPCSQYLKGQKRKASFITGLEQNQHLALRNAWFCVRHRLLFYKGTETTISRF